MATLVSWFRILRWSLILTLILIIILYLAPLAFPRHFEKIVRTDDKYRNHAMIVSGLCIFGLIAIWCHYFYMTLLFGFLMVIYLIVELTMFQVSNIGTWLPIGGIVICSFTLSAALRRLKHEAMYGV